MNVRLTNKTTNKKTSFEKLAATHMMSSCKSLIMNLIELTHCNMAYRNCLFFIYGGHVII